MLKYNGSWCKRELLAAALTSPRTVGWSGIPERKMSRWFLKKSTWSVLVLLRLSGKRLKICAPLTPRDCSLALLTYTGADFTISLGVMLLPLLSFELKFTLHFNR